MSQIIDASILTHFASLEKIRDIRGKEHLLLDIITIALCAVLSGAEGWENIAEYGRAKQDWHSLLQFARLELLHYEMRCAFWLAARTILTKVL